MPATRMSALTQPEMSCPMGYGAAADGDGAPAATTAAPSDVHTMTKVTDSMLSYGRYLKVEQLLSLQELESAKHGKPAHDELLFIVIHQVYELWFKEILFEIDALRELFSGKAIAERMMLRAVSGLNRVVEILRVCVQQVAVLETMTPLGFMEFRDYLSPSSGFQSMQFRLLENKLGIKRAARLKYHEAEYTAALSEAERSRVDASEREPSVLELVQAWLERTPGLEEDGFNFWHKYTSSIRKYLAELLAAAEACPDPETRTVMLQDHKKTAASYESILDERVHATHVEQGDRRFSHRALRGALMIFLYRDEPRFSLPFTLLQSLMEIDSQIMKWRHNHVTMVQRMIGSKAGTGGSSGYNYLRATVSDRYKVFIDLFNLTTFLPPHRFIPPLTTDILQRLHCSDAAHNLVF